MLDEEDGSDEDMLAQNVQAKMSKGFSDSNKSWLKLMNADKLSSDDDDDDEDDDMPMVWRITPLVPLVGCR